MKGTFKTALIAAVVSAFVAAGAAVATTKTFVLGTTNTVDAASTVTAGATGLNAKMLQLTNNSTGSSATALALTTPGSRPPMIVSSSAKVANLNVDKLDGTDSTACLPKTGKAADSDKLDGLDSSSFARTDVTPPWNLVSGTTTTGEPGKFACQGTSSFCWHNYGSPWGAAAFMKDALGFVHLKGLVQCSVAGFSCDTGLSATIFVLPEGYRPGAQGLFPSVSYDGNTHTVARIDVATDGRVIPVQGIPATFMTLDGITFQATH